MKIEGTVADLENGVTRHVTGEWDSVDEMEEELQKDGLILIWHTVL